MLNRAPTDFDDLEGEEFSVPRSEQDVARAAALVTRTVERTAEGRNYRSAADRSQESGDLHWEKCDKCQGTGRFVAWSGRVLGACRKCNGKGQLGFKVPKDVREAARDRAVERKANRLAEDRAAWVAANPEVAAWVFEAAETGFEFAVSLQAALDKYGSLTENQTAAALRCVEKRRAARAAAEERAAAAPTVSVARIEEAFATARSHQIKFPKLRLLDYVFSPAGANSRNPGAIYVKSGEQYLGKVQGGRFLAARDCSPDQEREIVAAATDPAAAAVAYGRRTGSCAICSRELTRGESIDRGIGPICAERFGW